MSEEAPRRAGSRPGVAVLTGAGHIVLGPGGSEEEADPIPYLRDRKSRKYMGLQDEMAVVAAGRALHRAGLEAPLGEDVGLFLAVGLIPFRYADIQRVVEASLVDDHFSLERFASEGYARARPLIAFRCLPNMPAHHVSANFDLQGPYLVAYPGAGQLYQALDAAMDAIGSGRIEIALVGGVAHHHNFLVRHHFARLLPPVPAERLRDAAAFLVLEGAEAASRRGAPILARLEAKELRYERFDPRVALPAGAESLRLGASDIPTIRTLYEGLELGPASLPAALSEALETPGFTLDHALHARDGVVASSRWTAP
ncbi:MAG: hypothetical protein OEY14_09075 [Myxococcales bacterium]|nr:hypothetical protein [Myxococcales bacterium]